MGHDRFYFNHGSFHTCVQENPNARLTHSEVSELRTSAVRNWEDFTPGVYRYVYPHLLDYKWIVVLGITPDGRYRYVDIRDTKMYGSDYGPVINQGYLSDAGVKRDEVHDYLGTNFVVKSDRTLY